MRSIRLALLFLLISPCILAQSLTLQLKDSETGNPVPYASVVTGAQTGTISNGEGYFTVELQRVDEILKISCMGYRTLEIPKTELSEDATALRLVPAAINLNEVRVGERIPSADEIIRNVVANLDKNYAPGDEGYEVFLRESEHMKFNELLLELEKASDLNKKDLRTADARLRQLGTDIVKSNPRNYMDLKASWKKTSDTTTAIQVARVTELIDMSQDFSMDNIEERAKGIIMDHLDPDQTYKVKSGMFKIEDSISPAMEFEESEAEADSISMGYLKPKISRMMKVASLQEGTFIRRFLDPDAYKYTFLEATYFDGYYVYAIRFQPDRRKSKYTGVLYVESQSYGILKADWNYAKGKHGSKMNLRLLLGVKYSEDLSRGTVIYKRDQNLQLVPYFLEQEYGSYVYLHRDLKFIENSPKKKKVRFDFLLEGRSREKAALLVKPATPGALSSMPESEPEKIPLIRLDRYEPTVWQDSEIIEPLEEMKNFKVSTKKKR
ncbi:CarboxypepD_reg-like domain-containing protein [Robiginitalea myxolifaciens]|uniref:CarboxypepD_reg-like domain-containing protein n=1 Tax=Robiginitalea myxolifaciens TaxID=400055 RepID=A0A1I6GW85_9FLAO|nr:carboxypeptidase-like regulatory domain-containing protein [Robiginitalea myxolifaciens]SFR46341.1 CarboxypepD_reg-like domain-containing protein [Robiginitalea myxolifaciens]